MAQGSIGRIWVIAVALSLGLLNAGTEPSAGAERGTGEPATARISAARAEDGALLVGADARSIVPMRDGEVDLEDVYLGGYGLGPYRVYGHDHGEPITYVGDNRPAEDVHPVEIESRRLPSPTPAAMS